MYFIITPSDMIAASLVIAIVLYAVVCLIKGKAPPK